jgi:hypothetical protein
MEVDAACGRKNLPDSRTDAAIAAWKKHRNASNRKGSRPKHQRACVKGFAPRRLAHKVEKKRKVNCFSQEIDRKSD